MSVLDDQPVIEASLGGRVDRVEMQVFAEELVEFYEDWGGEPFYVLFDYSKAQAFDPSTAMILDHLKDVAFEYGAAKVYTVPQETDELSAHVEARIQQVLEGREEILAFASQAQYAPLTASSISLAA